MSFSLALSALFLATGNKPKPRARHTSILINNILYIIGGYGNGNVYNLKDIYYINLNSLVWEC